MYNRDGSVSPLLFLLCSSESSVRGQLSELITQATLLLTLLGTLALIVAWFPQATALGVLLMGAYLIWQNLRELLFA